MPSFLSHAVRILLINNHVTFCAGLRVLIESQHGLNVIGEARDHADALVIAARDRPDIILLDLDLDTANGLDLLSELRAAAIGARFLVLTGLHDPTAYYRALQLGALGIVLKEQIVESLTHAIKEVYAGKAWLDGAVMAKVLDCLSSGIEQAAQTDSEAAKVATLTGREREIIALVSEGLRNQQIANRLFISEGTVRNHLTVIFDKLELSDRCALIVYAHQQRLNRP